MDKHGTNAKTFFEDLFSVLNTKIEEREAFKKEREKNGHVVDATIMAFPYVNGGLFKDQGFIPDFDIATRNQLLVHNFPCHIIHMTSVVGMSRRRKPCSVHS